MIFFRKLFRVLRNKTFACVWALICRTSWWWKIWINLSQHLCFVFWPLQPRPGNQKKPWLSSFLLSLWLWVCSSTTNSPRRCLWATPSATLRVWPSRWWASWATSQRPCCFSFCPRSSTSSSHCRRYSGSFTARDIDFQSSMIKHTDSNAFRIISLT